MIIPPIPAVDPLANGSSEMFLTSISLNAEHAVTQDATAVVHVLEAIRSAYGRSIRAEENQNDAAIVELHGR